MTRTLADLASALRAAASDVTRVETAVAGVGPTGFSASPTGSPGEFGPLADRLHHTWAEALEARVQEAAALARTLDDAAGAVQTSADRYVAVEEQNRRLWTEGL
jgi:hypothetical protein